MFVPDRNATPNVPASAVDAHVNAERVFSYLDQIEKLGEAAAGKA